MSWAEILAVVSLAIAVTSAADRLLQRLLSGQYATRDQLGALDKTFTSTQIMQGTQVREANHRIDLIAKAMEGLPGYSQHNELKNEIGEVKKDLAVNSSKLEDIGKDVHEVRAAVDRLGDEIRKRG